MPALCPICTVRPLRGGSTCGHTLCVSSAVWSGLSRLAARPKQQALNEARAIEAKSRAMAVALVERKAS